MDELLKEFIGWDLHFIATEKILDIKYVDNCIYITTDVDLYKLYIEEVNITYEDLLILVDFMDQSITISPTWWNHVGTKWYATKMVTEKKLVLQECE